MHKARHPLDMVEYPGRARADSLKSGDLPYDAKDSKPSGTGVVESCAGKDFLRF